MSSEYSADVGAILAGNRVLAETVMLSRKIGPGFQRDTEAYHGCFGETGVGDDFADQVVPLVERTDEALLRAVNAMSEAFLALIDATGTLPNTVQQPQVDATDDIHDQMGRNEAGPRR